MTDDATVVWSDAQISTEVDGAYVLMNADDNEFYDLNRTASAIWSMLEQPIAVGELSARLTDQFGVDPDRCRREVVDLLERLAERGMVEVTAPS